MMKLVAEVVVVATRGDLILFVRCQHLMLKYYTRKLSLPVQWGWGGDIFSVFYI
jgi:hypothetical protein